jgi:hypothetical protein
MATVIKKTNEVTVTDITDKAKQILSIAMNNFCRVENKEEKEKAIYLAERHNYWLGLGLSNEEATGKANDDYKWSF